MSGHGRRHRRLLPRQASVGASEREVRSFVGQRRRPLQSGDVPRVHPAPPEVREHDGEACEGANQGAPGAAVVVLKHGRRETQQMLEIREVIDGTRASLSALANRAVARIETDELTEEGKPSRGGRRSGSDDMTPWGGESAVVPLIAGPVGSLVRIRQAPLLQCAGDD